MDSEPAATTGDVPASDVPVAAECAPVDEKGRRQGRVWLAAILVLAAFLRLYDLEGMPPGMYTDEVSVAYNAHSLLKTGKDWNGRRWPLLHFEAYGDRPNCLYLYLSVPFQVMGGMNKIAHRLPSAVGSIATVLLICFVAGRMFGRPVGLVAAGMLAICPWHILTSRMAMSSTVSLDPMLILGAMAVILWAGLPLGDEPVRARPARAAVAGLLVPVALYGYWASKLFLPPLLVVAAVLCWWRWRELLGTGRGRLAVALLAGMGLIALSPVIYDLATSWGAGSARMDAVWAGSKDSWTGAWAAAGRYLPHYGVRFLFLKGDRMWAHALTGGGVLYWFMLPLMLAGLGVAVARARRSPAARVLLAWLVLYPLPDLLATHPTPHLLRSSPGIGAFCILAALGAVWGVGWLRARWRRLAAAAVGVILAAAGVGVGRYAYLFFVDYPSRPMLHLGFYADYQEAIRWLRPQYDKLDAVYCTFPHLYHQPFAYMLFGLEYDPARWQGESHRILETAQGRTIVAFGKVRFLTETARYALESLMANDTAETVAFIVRPGQIESPAPPVYQVRLPNGDISLVIYVLQL